ncbi:SPOR domain-containing protein [Sphingomonas endolithica]|uniref:SPOR domain-containing protein n=1 Tax=Sphingomonas endolithica TaxID=2972485 RepID=UPI0021AF31E7|nr:SPOR domain-containing protein [Sphingomonas sp. ZFBP2030]
MTGPIQDDGYPAGRASEAPLEQVDLPPSQPGASYAPPGERDAARPIAPPATLPPEIAGGTGPRGTSGEAQRYDAVGYAGRSSEEGEAVTAVHRRLPIGSVVEVTALDSGRTILVLVTDSSGAAPDSEIDLSRGAATQLGLNGPAPVRVRLVNAPPSDIMALRGGRAAPPRIDSPPALLAALRRKLPTRADAAVPPPPRRPATRPVPAGAPYVPPAPARPVTAGIFVQVAALSNEGRAQALATSLRGRVARAGAFYRVQIGPFANMRAAQQARDDAARRGYGGARIVKTN